MMSNEDATSNYEDILAGKVTRGKKKDGGKAAYFSIMLFEIDPKTMQPKVIGEVEIKGKKYPKHRILRTFRVAESSLLKVANDDQKSCNLYWKRQR